MSKTHCKKINNVSNVVQIMQKMKKAKTKKRPILYSKKSVKEREDRVEKSIKERRRIFERILVRY